jgi:hypothetical protein
VNKYQSFATMEPYLTNPGKNWSGWNALTLWTHISCYATGLLSYSYYFASISPTISSQDRLSNKAEVFFGHPFIFQKSGKSTIIRNLAVLRHFVAYLVFISSIRVDPGPRNRGPSSLLALKIRTFHLNVCFIYISA